MKFMKIFLKPYVGIPVTLFGFFLLNQGWIYIGAVVGFSYALTMLGFLLATNSLKKEQTWGSALKLFGPIALIAAFTVPVIVQHFDAATERTKVDKLMLRADQLCPKYIKLPDGEKGNYPYLSFCELYDMYGAAKWKVGQADTFDRRGMTEEAAILRGDKVAAVDTETTTASTTPGADNADKNGLWK